MIRKDIAQPPKMPCFRWKMLMGLYKGYFSLLLNLETWQNNHDALCLYLFNDCFYLQVFEASASFQVILWEALGLLFLWKLPEEGKCAHDFRGLEESWGGGALWESGKGLMCMF